MNNPGHNGTFNKAAESVERDAQRRLMNTPREWDEAAEQARVLDEEATAQAFTRDDEAAEREIRLRDATTYISKEVANVVSQAEEPKDPNVHLTYRQEVDFNDDGTPNVMAPKE